MVRHDSPWRVPRSRAEQTHRALREPILAALEPLLFEDVMRAKGVRHELERAFALVSGHTHATAVHSATIGLFLALRACGVGPGDEVITVGNSDVSTTAAISHCGATPVLCDVRADEYTIDPALIPPLITSRTRAILPVDLYGHPADVKSLRPIAERHGLRIVEDAALATGATDHGQPVGAFADAVVFSFAPFKPLGSAGNGGIVATSDPEIARTLRLLVEYGHSLEQAIGAGSQQRHVAEGYNVPIDPLQAAIVSVKLSHLEEWSQRRREIAAQYEAGLRGTRARLPTFRDSSQPTFRSYTIRVPNQQAMYEALRACGVEAVVHYSPPVYRQPLYSKGLRGSDHLAVTDRLASEIVCLPVTVELTNDEIEFVINAVRELLA